MANLQIVFDFTCAGYGWSESWVTNSAQPSLKAFYTASAEQMALKRAAMLAAEARLEAISCSFVADKQDSYLRYVNMPGNQQVHCDSPHTTIYTILRGDNDRSRKAVFVRGQDDNVVMNGGIFQPGADVFVQAATTYFNAIVAGSWGWMRSVKGNKVLITDYVVDPEGCPVLTLGAATFPVPAPGQPVYKKVRILFPGRASVLNGTHVVQVVDADTVRIQKPIAVFPFQNEGWLQAYDEPTLQLPENWNFQKSGRRAAGAPKLRTPGRARAAARG